MGHNGVPRTYTLLRRLYYWKGLKPMVRSHVKAYKLCQMYNKQVVKYNKLNFETQPAPMKFISMDIIGEFDPPSSKGNKYALTVICMHTGYTFCIPIPDKTAGAIVKAYINHVYCWFGGSHKIPTDNGKEIIKEMPDYSQFGRKTTLRLNPDKIPDFKLEISYYFKYCTHIRNFIESVTIRLVLNKTEISLFNKSDTTRRKR